MLKSKIERLERLAGQALDGQDDDNVFVLTVVDRGDMLDDVTDAEIEAIVDEQLKGKDRDRGLAWACVIVDRAAVDDYRRRHGVA